MVEATLHVSTDVEAVRAMVDVQNALLPPAKRIADTEYKFHEALVMARRDLGTINTQAADDYVRKYVEKPKMEARSFRNYRNSLVSKGWLSKKEKAYHLLPGFDLVLRDISKPGCLTDLRILIQRK